LNGTDIAKGDGRLEAAEVEMLSSTLKLQFERQDQKHVRYVARFLSLQLPFVTCFINYAN
jgi:hypothetical protein